MLFSGSVPSSQHEATVLSIPVTPNGSHQSIHLNPSPGSRTASPGCSGMGGAELGASVPPQPWAHQTMLAIAVSPRARCFFHLHPLCCCWCWTKNPSHVISSQLPSPPPPPLRRSPPSIPSSSAAPLQRKGSVLRRRGHFGKGECLHAQKSRPHCSAERQDWLEPRRCQDASPKLRACVPARCHPSTLAIGTPCPLLTG